MAKEQIVRAESACYVDVETCEAATHLHSNATRGPFSHTQLGDNWTRKECARKFHALHDIYANLACRRLIGLDCFRKVSIPPNFSKLTGSCGETFAAAHLAYFIWLKKWNSPILVGADMNLKFSYNAGCYRVLK